MKKIILTIIAALTLTAAFSPALQARDKAERQARREAIGSMSYNDFKPSELRISYGFESLYAVINQFAGIFGAVFSFGQIKAVDPTSYGAVALGYSYTILPALTIGGDLTYEYADLEFTMKNDDKKIKKGAHVITPMATIRSDWFRRKHFSAYSKLGVGVMVDVVNGEKAKANFGVQISPVGISFGNQNVRGFLEAGFGCNGLLLAGLSFRL